MASPLELIPAIAAIISFVIYYRVANRSGSGLFAYGLLIAAAIAIATLAISLAPANPAAQAVTDMGILLAGALAFAASGWLLFVFCRPGDTDGR